MKRLPNGVMAAGILFAICGLLFLPAGIGPAREEAALAGGAMMFSTGVLFVALGIYLKARLLRQDVSPPVKSQRKKDKCEACEAETASVRCTLHDIRLCPACLPHHDIVSCSYVPITRKMAAAAPSR